MSDKSFKVKSGLQIPGVTSANILTTDSSGNVSSSSTLAIANGGTGQTTATNAINALLPLQTSNDNYFLQTSGVSPQWSKVFYQAIKDNGTTVTPRGYLNIVGGTFSDDSLNDITTLTIPTNYVSTAGGSTITASTASTKGLIVQGAASQTADLQQWQDSAANVMVKVNNLGLITANGVSSSGATNATTNTGALFTTNSASRTPIGVRGAASQTADLQYWQNSGGTALAAITSSGRIWASSMTVATSGAVTAGSQFGVVISSASTVGVGIKAAASQTANLQEWQDSAGTANAKVDSSGNIFTATRFATTSSTPNIFGVVYGNANATNYAEGSFATNAGFSSPTVFPNEEGWYPYFAYQVPDLVETSDDGTTWTNQAPMAYAGLFAYQPTHVNTVSNKYLRITMNQPTFTFLGLAVARFQNGTNYRSFTMKTELLNSSGGNVATFGPTAGTGVYDGAILAQKFNSYNGSTTATRITIENTNFVAGDTFNLASLMTYLSKPGTGKSFQTKFPMVWNRYKTTTFQPTQPGSVALIVKAKDLSSTITNAVGDGTTVTFTTSANNSFVAGNSVTISGINPSAYNLGSVVIASVPTGNTFTVTNAATGTYVSGGTAYISHGSNIQEWQNNSGTVNGAVSNTGSRLFMATSLTAGSMGVTTATINALPTNAATVGLLVKGFASQTANLQEWQNSSGTLLGRLESTGKFVVTGNMVTLASMHSYNIATLGTNETTYSSSTLSVSTRNAASEGLIIRGVASQTANLQEWQNSSGTVLASLSASGNLMVQDLTVNGTTTTINSTTLTVDDKNIELASVSSPTDTTADGAGITIKGATDKTFNWVQSTAAFTSSEPISAPAFKSAGTAVSSNITLVSGYRYFVDTTAARTLTLPASPSLGDEIQIYDASNSALTNNITVASNSNKIQGSVQDLIIDSNAATVYLTYTGSTYGWAVN